MNLSFCANYFVGFWVIFSITRFLQTVISPSQEYKKTSELVAR